MRWKRLGYLLATLVILGANLAGITALATEDEDPLQTGGFDDVPTGVLKGYTPVYDRIKTGEHFEYFGWPGAPFSRLVTDYSEVLCCKKTYRAMDGCKDLKICSSSL